MGADRARAPGKCWDNNRLEENQRTRAITFNIVVDMIRAESDGQRTTAQAARQQRTVITDCTHAGRKTNQAGVCTLLPDNGTTTAAVDNLIHPYAPRTRV